jgi:predicted transcriptional regulator YdeE
MLKPYIVEKGLIRIIGKSVWFGGNRPNTGEIGDLFSDMSGIIDCIPNRIDEPRFLGISINHWNSGGKARMSYMLGAEVSSLETYPFDHECKVIPASRWVYVPIRYDDPDVLALATPDKHDDMSHMTGAVFGWTHKWISENGYTKQDFPEEFEIYGLYDGYGFPENLEGGANLTIAVPIV